MSENQSKLVMAATMIIFGTIGIFRRYLPLTSAMLAFARGAVGTLFLLIFCAVSKKPLSGQNIRRNLRFLLLSGGMIGLNWILLFEAYRYTTVSTATLCYYMAPVFVTLASPFVLKERLTAKKIVCIAVAFAGMVLVSDILNYEEAGSENMKGILFGLGAACLYACVILTNQKLKAISAYEKTVMQLGSAAAVMIPYLIITGSKNLEGFTVPVFLIMLFVCIVHTGIAYAMYFGSMGYLKAQTTAIMGYIDPIVAIILSALFLHEPMGPAEIVGAVLVLGATIAGEVF